MTPTAQPHIQVLYNATQSVAGATVLSSVIVIMAIFGCVNMVATCSRQLYAFARDDGLPFSAFLARVRPSWDLPLNSTFVSFGITVLLSLINIGCKSSAFGNETTTDTLCSNRCVQHDRLHGNSSHPVVIRDQHFMYVSEAMAQRGASAFEVLPWQIWHLGQWYGSVVAA